MGFLRVIVDRIASERKEILWEMSGDKGDSWKQQRITIKSQEDFKVISNYIISSYLDLFIYLF